MQKEKTALFIGHKQIPAGLADAVTAEIVRLAKDGGAVTFLNGGMGGFDMLCARCVNRVKAAYPNVRHCIVLPYLAPERYRTDLFDESLYPGLENVPPQAAIVRRNRWMVENASHAICYVEHGFGGAAGTWRYAVKKGLSVVNLGSYRG